MAIIIGLEFPYYYILVLMGYMYILLFIAYYARVLIGKGKSS